MKLSPRKCDGCSQLYSTWGPICEACIQIAVTENAERVKEWERQDAERRAKAIKEAEELDIKERDRWKLTFVNEFPEGIDRARIPDVSGHDLGLAWLRASKKLNLFVHGDTGMGKTLLLQAIAAHVASGYRGAELWSNAIVLTDGMDFQNTVPDRARGVYRIRTSDDEDDDASLEFYLAKIRNAGHWICDEAGQLKGTPRVTAELLKLLNERHRQRMPTILASFLGPAEWCKELNKTDHQYGRQIARRLDDWFQIIELKRGQP